MYYKNMYERRKQRRKDRIYETVECLKQGMNTKQIAEELGVCQKTVQRYVKYIRENQ